MQFTLNEIQKEIKENSTKLLKENIDLLKTIQKVDDNCRLDENIKTTILPEIISGEKIGTYCVYENDKYLTSSDEISTTLTKDKNGYILKGQKKYVIFGDVSDYFAILANSKEGSMFV